MNPIQHRPKSFAGLATALCAAILAMPLAHAEAQEPLSLAKASYFFVRPKKKVLEVWFFLGRTLKSTMVRKTLQSSKAKVAHLVHITHRDQVEAPLS